MNKSKSIILFNQKKIRRSWDEKNEIWYFSIIDVVEILTDSPRPRKYWNALKTKLKQEGSELSQKVGQLKLVSADGKNIYLQDPEIGKVRKLNKEDFMRVWFDFTGKYIKADELIIRQIIAIYR